MDMLVDLKDLACDLSELITGLLQLGQKIEMEVRVHLHSERREKRIAVLVSKEPHCLRQIIEDSRLGKLHGKLAIILSNHPDLGPIAKEAGIPFASNPSENPERHFDWLLKSLNEAKADLIVLARYMRILPARIVQAFANRIINIHPSLLPFFPGASPYKQAYESGVRV